MFIYLITNNINGKYYVGQTKRSVASRWLQHIYDSRIDTKYKKNMYLYSSIRKYGQENFDVELLCECPNQEVLNETEKFFIWFLGSSKRSIGYNTTLGGNGIILPKEARIQIGLKQRGKKKSEEAKANMRKGNVGRTHPSPTKETRDRIRKSLLGRKHSEERKANGGGTFKKGHIPWNKGIPVSEEQKERQRSKLLGVKRGPYKKRKTNNV